MFRCIVLLMLLSVSDRSFGSEHQMIDTLGTSSKGQFVGIEEYGYKSQSHTYYVTIKVMNVWTKKYVGQIIEVELPAHRPSFLIKARSRARILAQDHLKNFGISV